jgi:cyclic pyranopterin phosphate synthase
MSRLSHLDAKGAAHMVDVSGKPVTAREASAEATVTLSAEAFAAVIEGTAPKGDVLAAARIAGIMAAKKVPELIPLCHPLAIAKAAVEFEPDADCHAIRIIATVATSGQTGVEMEALTAASVAALTLYDMIKAVDKSAVIETVRLLAKSGGKSGDYKAPSSKTAKTIPAASRVRPAAPSTRAKPQALMGEVAAPRAQSQGANVERRREAFRAFMTSRRLRPTVWAKQAGVASGEILGFLTGRSRGFSQDVAEKLARAARVQVGDMFS